ncbi:hypothetical protein GPJ56_007723 [Histomonas meleagridis]|uniref:uncharacterized protein n=1 Tax=Histomonas meleagridis TaxID=135588 RepID=UPI003559DDFF|nr:hypothetical protein GPJ56_007723 [Histomonas meleagridis]KAH0801549.1 hypothetical protein GO595_005685 [Histomonas meleagridis]
MISNEEFEVFQEQMVRLTNQKEDILTKIDKLQANETQIPIFEQSIQESQKQLEIEREAYEKEEKILNAQLANPVAQKSLSLNSLFGSSEDNQVHVLEQKLHAELEKVEQLENEETEVAMNLANAATAEQQITFQLEKSELIVSKFRALIPQIQACSFHGLYIQDLLYQYEDLKHLKDLQNGKRNRLNNWIKQTKTVTDAQENNLRSLESELSEIEWQISQKKSELSQKSDIYHKLSYELSEHLLEVNEKLNKANEMSKSDNSEIKKILEQIERQKNTLNELQTEINQLQSKIQASEINKKKSTQKKIELIQQLEKRIIIERKNRSVTDIDSPIVIELSNLIDNYISENEEIETKNQQIEQKLKSLQFESERKSMIIKELERIGNPNAKNITDDKALKAFEQLANDIYVQNKCNLDNIKSIGIEVNELENSIKYMNEYLEKNRK